MKQTSIIALLGSILLLASCAKPLQPEFRKFDQVKINASMPNIDIVMEVGVDAVVFNPNKSSLKMEELDAELFVEGKTVGKVQAPINATLAANKESRVPISFKQELGTTFKGYNLTMSELAGTKTVAVKLVGVLKAEKGVEIPIDQSLKYEMPAKVIMNYLLNNR